MGSILVVQTDPSSPAWDTVLERAGHTVQVVTVADALSSVRDGGTDVIVIDAIDPRMGIVDLARSIAILPDAPPVVLVSGSPHAPEISVRIGAAAFLPKPCDPAELVALVGRMTNHTRPVFLVDFGDGDEDNEPTMMTAMRAAGASGKIVAS